MDVRRIAFVTRRFRDLQGLRMVSYGMALVIGAFTFGFMPESHRDPMLHVGTFVIVSASAADGALRRYYARGFGVVGDRLRFTGSGSQYSPPALLAHLVSMGLMFDMLLVAIVKVSPLSVGAVTLIIGSVWILVRDGPQRFHYLISVFAGATACVVTAIAPAPSGKYDAAAGGYYVLAAGIIGVSLVVTGLMDHRVLVQTMWRPPESDSASPAPNYLSRLRILMAGWVLVVVAWYLAVHGRPLEPVTFSLVLLVMFIPVTVMACSDEWTWGFRAYSELTRTREARLLARVTNASVMENELPDRRHLIPRPDFVGHLVLPTAVAAGALVDVVFRSDHLPSAMLLAVACSHLRIAVRDWPARGHYLAGAVAASVGSLLRVIGGVSPLDWLAAVLLLVGAANLFEGWMDRGLETGRRSLLRKTYGHTV